MKRKTIEEKNKEFMALPKAQKRIAIAKDVISSINADKIIASPGTYLALDVSEEINPGSLQLLLKNPREINECRVCALGAAFYSTVNKCNTFNIKKRHLPTENKAFMLLDKSDMISLLGKFFSPMQLALIESAFESTEFNPIKLGRRMTKAEKGQLKVARSFGSNYDYYSDEAATLLLIKIMQNIIDNNGIFKPSK